MLSAGSDFPAASPSCAARDTTGERPPHTQHPGTRFCGCVHPPEVAFQSDFAQVRGWVLVTLGAHDQWK